MNLQLGLMGIAPTETSIPPLVSAFPGQKQGTYFDVLRGGCSWPVIIEPFVGSGYSSLNMGAEQTFIGDVQDWYWLWKTWISGDWGRATALIEDWRQRFRPIVQEYQGIPDEREQSQRLRNSETWQALRGSYLPNRDGSRSVEAVAAAWVLRRVGWMALGRTNAAGEWNVSADVRKMTAFVTNPLPRFPLRQGDWMIGHGWEECLRNYRDYGNHSLDAVALVDPPYYFPLEAMPPGERQTSAYPGHDPHDPRWVEIFEDCLYGLAEMPSIKRIVAWNYRCEGTDGAARGAAVQTGRSIVPRDFGNLRQMSNHRRKPGPPSPAREGCWILGQIGSRGES